MLQDKHLNIQQHLPIPSHDNTRDTVSRKPIVTSHRLLPDLHLHPTYMTSPSPSPDLYDFTFTFTRPHLHLHPTFTSNTSNNFYQLPVTRHLLLAPVAPVDQQVIDISRQKKKISIPLTHFNI